MDENPDPKEPPNEQFEFMKEKLPPYVVQCFLAAGFDTAEVISSMDPSDDPGNSISAIELFIDKYYHGNKDFSCTPGLDEQHPFVFPPGHRIRIYNFIYDVKRATSKKRAYTSETCKPRPRPKLQNDSDAEPETQSVSSVSCQIRCSISKWIKRQPDVLLRSLQENKQFSIIVARVPKSEAISASVKCNACTSTMRLYPKKGSYIISNWTRHVKGCTKLYEKPAKKKSINQQSLKTFLSPEHLGPNSSSSISDDTASGDNITSSSVFEGCLSFPSNEHNDVKLTCAQSLHLDTSEGNSSEPSAHSNSNLKHAASTGATLDWSRRARLKRKLEQDDSSDQMHLLDLFFYH